jgi:hypothetical protein
MMIIVRKKSVMAGMADLAHNLVAMGMLIQITFHYVRNYD